MRTFVLWCLSLLGPFEDIAKAMFIRLAWLILLVMDPLLFVAAAFGRFIVRWWNSRDRLWLAQGMPAFLTAIAVCATSLAAWLPTRRDIATKYLQLALKTSEAGDDASAALYVEKASRGRAWNASDSTEFQRVKVMEQMGRVVEARELLLSLAPLDRVGHIPAHELVIDRLSADKENPRAEELIKIHTTLILTENPKHARVHRLLAVRAIKDKDLESAIDHLSYAVAKFPRLRLPYAQLLRVAGREDEAVRQAEMLILFFEPLFAADASSKEESTIKDRDRVAYSACLTMLERYDEAIMKLRTGPSAPEAPILRNAMANTFLIWSDTFDSESMVGLTEKMIRLDSALKLAPNSPAILSRVAQVSTLKGKPAEEANNRLRLILASGKAPAIVHFILGTSYAEANDTEKALFHLEQASRINPYVPVTLNNLAWVTCHTADVQRPQLEHAHRLIQKALKFKPRNPQFRETHGQVLLKLEEWRDAITEFEFALQNLKGAQPEIHRALAVAYEQVGDMAMSKMHRDLIGAVTGEPAKSSDELPGAEILPTTVSPQIKSSQIQSPVRESMTGSAAKHQSATAESMAVSGSSKPKSIVEPGVETGKLKSRGQMPVPPPKDLVPGEVAVPTTPGVEILPGPVVEELPPPSK